MQATTTNISQFMRYYAPGIFVFLLLLPTLFVILPETNFTLFTILFAVISPGIGYVLYLSIWWVVNKKIAHCWDRELKDSWEEEFTNWICESWFFPKARIGYRVRRLRYLIKKEKEDIENKLQNLKVTSSEIRGIIDFSTITSFPQSTHQYRLDMAYGTAAICLASLISLPANIFFLLYKIFYSTCLSFDCIFILIAIIIAIFTIYLSRKIAGMELERAEWIQYCHIIKKEDSDFKEFCEIIQKFLKDFDN